MKIRLQTLLFTKWGNLRRYGAETKSTLAAFETMGKAQIAAEAGLVQVESS